MAFSKKNIRHDQKFFELLDRILGRLTLTFTKDQVHSHCPDEDVRIPSNQHPMTSFDTSMPYTVLYTGEKVIVIVDREEATNTERVHKYNFDSPEVMWVDMGGADYLLPNLADREYFRRIR